MNRTLKFRAWDKLLKEMLTGYGFLVGASGKFYLDTGFDEVTASDSRRDDFVMMQFTGLKDKNGKEIYEGDVLRLIDSEFEEGNNYVTVEWNNEVAGFDPFIDYVQFSISPVSGVGDDPKNCEVIGNVFENPELISSTEPSPTSNPIEASQKSDLAPK